jgi:hypothetical protein
MYNYGMNEENILSAFTKYMEKAAMQIAGGGEQSRGDTAQHVQVAPVISGNNEARINQTPVNNNTMSPGVTNPSSGAPAGTPPKAKALDLSPNPPKS